MPQSDSNPPSLSYIKADNRRNAVNKMIAADPLLSQLYDDGPNHDGKAGWVNAIRDQNNKDAYHLLFYIDRIPMSDQYRELDQYEVLYGSVKEHEEVNWPRVLFTTTGAVNLMRDGLPGQRFIDALQKGILEIVPFKLGRDVKTRSLRESGSAYLGLYDREGQGIRILDLLDYSMVYDSRNNEEVQVHHEEEIVVGDTRFVQPFLMRYSRTDDRESNTTNSAAEKALESMSKRSR